MSDVPRQQLALFALALVAVGLIGARYLAAERERAPAPQGPPAPVRLERSGETAVVHVTGAVRRPGVYRLPSSARLDLALKRAGGPAERADLQGVNLAARVSDGQQVIVPRRGVVATGIGAPGTPAAAPAAPVNLNTATVEQLDQLDGVGPVTAQKILDWRKQHGGFRSIDDLKQISGIGPKRFEALKDKVRM